MEPQMQKEWKKIKISVIRKEKTRKNLRWQGQDFVGEFEKSYKAGGVQNYCTMSEIKATFAEQKSDWWKKFHRYLVDSWTEYAQKRSHFITAMKTKKTARKTWCQRLSGVPTFFPHSKPLPQFLNSLETANWKPFQVFASPSIVYPSGRLTKDSSEKKIMKP